MTPNEYSRALSYGVHFYQRPQRDVLVIQPVGDSLGGIVANLGLAIKQRVIGRKIGNLLACPAIKGIVGSAHVGPFGLTTLFGHNLSGEN